MSTPSASAISRLSAVARMMRPNVVVGQIEPGSGAGRGAPDHADRVLHHEDDRERQEELERFVAVVDEAQKAALDDDTDGAHGEARERQRENEERGRAAGGGVPADGG